MDCHKVHAVIRKHGGGMRKLLKQYGKRRKSMEIGKKRKIDRGVEGVQGVDKTQRGLFP